MQTKTIVQYDPPDCQLGPSQCKPCFVGEHNYVPPEMKRVIDLGREVDHFSEQWAYAFELRQQRLHADVLGFDERKQAVLAEYEEAKATMGC